jgi:energy-coupling factor transporter ATP-binding protein EcfA2
MKTEFAEFCSKLGEEVASFCGNLGEVLARIKEREDAGNLANVLQRLGEVFHRLQILEDKVIGQQAYVSIFGPLKSGKSTLMNAISGTYVSEITSLPAYPCMVYVRDRETQQIVITSYDDSKQECADSREMQNVLHGAHKALAERIREADAQDEEFDPATHYPEAIRRVDIGLPSPALRESQTVLVDTPGLYSRMKFGYEMMTREFRDSAASAIFVVKTDNLFLEQVFEEFNELLELFSRIFLVVNIDSSKQDIGPDGQLHPSLESRDPQQIIDAFQALSMSAPLRKAAEEGRLKIYPIDLLHAALYRMKGDQETIPAVGKQALEHFQVFYQELADYLNSNEYLQEFMGDSWRQGRNLVEEVRKWCHPDQRKPFELLQQNLRLKLAQSEASLRDLKLFTEGRSAYGFEFASASFTEAIKSKGRQCASLLREETDNRLHAWWMTDESLMELAEGRITACIREVMQVFAENIHRSLQEWFSEQNGGLNITASQAAFLQEISLSLKEIREASLQAAKEYEEKLLNQHFEFQVEDIPVRRGWLDWLLFRSQTAVCRAFFGGADAPSRSISQKKKHVRLGDAGKERLQQQISNYLDRLCGTELQKYVRELLDVYTGTFQQHLKQQLADVEQRLQQNVNDIRTRLSANEQMLKDLNLMSEQAFRVQESLNELADAHQISRFS